MESDGDDDTPGYGRPPKAWRFKKGQSGNLKGRPKGTRNFRTDVKALLATRVRVKKGGIPTNTSVQEGALLRLLELGLVKGHVRALERLLVLAQTFNDDEPAPAETAELSGHDTDIVKRFAERFLQKHSAPKSRKNRPNGKKGGRS